MRAFRFITGSESKVMTSEDKEIRQKVSRNNGDVKGCLES